MSEVVFQLARIEQRNGRRWWLCPNCGKRLGEVLGARVVIRISDRTITMPLANAPDQTCPVCGAVSQVESGV